jgi:phosphate:Na+ symporter
MHVLSHGLEKYTGERIRKLVGHLTNSIPRGILAGTIGTAIIQSSSATTVIVVGLVNSGVMTLKQSVGVIMGANIGTTVTAQLLRLADIKSDIWYVNILNPHIFGPYFLVAGFLLYLYIHIRNHHHRHMRKFVSIAMIGLGMIFVGMNGMEQSVTSASNSEWLKSAFTTFRHPLIGVLVGTGVTALIQSSSASVGILQASASTGLISVSAAIPIIMGQNIGTCITCILAAIRANRTAKKAAVVHLLFNIFGTILIMPCIYIFKHFFSIASWDNPITRGEIANFHTSFNITCTLIFMWFSGSFVKLADRIVDGKKRR